MVDMHIFGEFSVYSKQSYQDRQLNYASRCWMLIRFSMYVPFVFLHRPFLTKFPFFFFTFLQHSNWATLSHLKFKQFMNIYGMNESFINQQK